MSTKANVNPPTPAEAMRRCQLEDYLRAQWTVTIRCGLDVPNPVVQTEFGAFTDTTVLGALESAAAWIAQRYGNTVPPPPPPLPVTAIIDASLRVVRAPMRGYNYPFPLFQPMRELADVLRAAGLHDVPVLTIEGQK